MAKLRVSFLGAVVERPKGQSLFEERRHPSFYDGERPADPALYKDPKDGLQDVHNWAVELAAAMEERIAALPQDRKERVKQAKEQRAAVAKARNEERARAMAQEATQKMAKEDPASLVAMLSPEMREALLAALSSK